MSEAPGLRVRLTPALRRAGVDIGHFGISLRYGLGLTKMIRIGNTSADVKNRAWYLLGSWAFKTAD